MDDLVVWLRQQLDDDELLALAASPGPWAPNAESSEVMAVDGITVADGFALSGPQLRGTVEHIARHDPARVLREVEAKKRRLDEFAKARAWLFTAEDPTVQITVAAMCATWDTAIRIDAATVYAERPGYREQWKP